MKAVECGSVIFLYLKGRTSKATFNEPKGVCGDDAPPYDVMKHQRHQWKCGWTSVEMATIPGQSRSTIDDNTIHKVEVIILENLHINI